MRNIEEKNELSNYELLMKKAAELEINIPLQAPFTPNDVNKLIPLLRMPLDDTAIQKAKSSDTGKTYDSVGYSYQAHVDRMNWVFGATNWDWQIINLKSEDSVTSNNYVKYVYSAEIKLLLGYMVFNEAEQAWKWLTVYGLPPIPTGHESVEEDSAHKGMVTKGIKRATSFLGVGADAYLGVLDDDLITGAEPGDRMSTPKYMKEKVIDSAGYLKLKNLAALKGLDVDTKLREFYKVESEGRIINDPANLTKSEEREVKGYLLKLPDSILSSKETGETAIQEPDGKTEDGQDGYPKTLAELMAADEEIIRVIASGFSFQLPDTLTDRNKSAICKTLAQLMGLK